MAFSDLTRNKLRWTTFLLQLLIVHPFLLTADSTWWALSQLPLNVLSVHIGTSAICDNTPGLIGQQRRICRVNPDVMISVAQGAHLAVRECQKQFRNNRWNCTTLPRDATVFGKATVQGTRETAVVYAMTSAAVVHSVTRSCSRGELQRCACDPNKVGRGRGRSHGDTYRSVTSRGGVAVMEWNWGGCSDNVQYGADFARMFVDAREKVTRDARALMNLHNNGAGRRAVRKQMKLQCKCHGVSGSCATRTCWLAMHDFRQVGISLRRRYDGATRVQMAQDGNSLLVANRHHKRPTKADLIYLEESPDFCTKDTRTGSLGTAGRLCRKSSRGTDGCDVMCCGRGYDTMSVERVDKCECKFHWCCEVTCKLCPRQVNIHTCKPTHTTR